MHEKVIKQSVRIPEFAAVLDKSFEDEKRLALTCYFWSVYLIYALNGIQYYAIL